MPRKKDENISNSVHRKRVTAVRVAVIASVAAVAAAAVLMMYYITKNKHSRGTNSSGASSNPSGSSIITSLTAPAEIYADTVAPDLYYAHFKTSKGSFVIKVHREWAPLAADRFYNLLIKGYFDGNAFFRALTGPTDDDRFLVQWGINGNPEVSSLWSGRTLPDEDPRILRQSNTAGMVAFAAALDENGKAYDRSTQVFVNIADNSNLDQYGFAPFGEVISGLEVVGSMNCKYGETPTYDQVKMYAEGNAYIYGERTRSGAYPDLDMCEWTYTTLVF